MLLPFFVFPVRPVTSFAFLPAVGLRCILSLLMLFALLFDCKPEEVKLIEILLAYRIIHDTEIVEKCWLNNKFINLYVEGIIIYPVELLEYK